MATLFHGPDTYKQDQAVLKQEKDIAIQEERQAKELASRRRLSGAGASSKTLFSSVEGMGNAATKKKTVLGG